MQLTSSARWATIRDTVTAEFQAAVPALSRHDAERLVEIARSRARVTF